MTRFSRKRGFTLIELLVVIVIIGVLAGTLMPVIGRALGFGDNAVAVNNLRLLGQAALAYRQEHGGCWPSAGGVFTEYTVTQGNRREDRYGRSRGWVYFEHDCPRANDPAKNVGDGNHDSYGVGEKGADDKVTGDFANEAGCCTCFNTKQREGGIGATPAAWADKKSGGALSQGEVAIINGALYDYVNQNLEVFTNPGFEKRAAELDRAGRDAICRAYAMNIVASADADLYDNDHYLDAGYEKAYCCPNNAAGHGAIRLGPASLKARTGEGNNERQAVSPTQTVLFVELDLDEENVKNQNDLAGDQVWDWDDGDERIGFNHFDGGWMAYVCFADGRVETLYDPSADPDNPDLGKREKLSKWYGSGGINRNGSKNGD